MTSITPISMQLTVLLPTHVLLSVSGVLRMVVETIEGSFGILPQRRDCVAALCAGMLTYQTAEEGEVFVAVDAGVLVKCGSEIRVSVRRALQSRDLHQLQQAVQQDFRRLDEDEQHLRTVMMKLENSFLHRLTRL
ncbi:MULTISPECIES: F0F1 ATP synthase subunit epsilon [unclassified Undibacterium]|uniref:F0F1 ATP synthase subunit epsilon n=1 Tax=unclassified Undibacterium TaxID=2630295 RepID=UPI002AC8CFA5|nr:MULTISPECIES: F0F1 ATP synthase subunit epsilon [unclassified Undibacterium]MEB0140631.1 F0F1 ATP synthase subunit epsilon [Undibacterium sp. CCC2.1]MEB0173660.1 F0F1 ATP synthase subunit epsilon [Undibacterium sp. CCC1.1]MEB0177644.1 F0F1 ATP synthase subunit epsilon [Undibacterium sp. CCC3.4]MEB0216839.1 F0F1 ATP synthase subunit epsilon [Undibacterium sp. 5I2]WPX41917.1 F0F1 ATP synthase subunit epsilon [Undibacterium sp. CCC3.4]